LTCPLEDQSETTRIEPAMWRSDMSLFLVDILVSNLPVEIKDIMFFFRNQR